MAVAASTHMADLIYRLRASRVILTYDQDTRTLRHDSIPAVTVGQKHRLHH
jgi:hypothetical protein